jgi:hypothetical protein
MSNIDEDKILELEISDDETFGLHGAGSPGKKRRIAEETVPEVVCSAVKFYSSDHSPFDISSGEALVRSVHSVIIQFSLESQHLSKQNPAGLPRTCSIRNSIHQIRSQGTYYDSSIHSLVEDNPYGRSAKPWPQTRALGPAPVQLFFDIAWNDRLGREFAENNLTSYEPKRMVHLSRSDVLKLIAKTGPLYYDANSSSKRNVCQVKSGNHINPEALRTFLLSVDDWRVLCFNTESDGKMLYKVKPNKGNPGRIPIVFGNPARQVLVFHNSRETPQELRDRCADFCYVKFQSGAEHDLAHLKRNGFSDF